MLDLTANSYSLSKDLSEPKLYPEDFGVYENLDNKVFSITRQFLLFSYK